MYLSKFQIFKGSESEDRVITNTRIGGHNIAGGAYHIPDDKYEQFFKQYYHNVIEKGEKEYLTEKQLTTDNSPILVDIDLRHKLSITARQYTQQHILDLITLYIDELKDIYQFDGETVIPIFVFSKPNINPVIEKKFVKDGIHLIIGLQCPHDIQCLLRQKILKGINNIWNDLNIINSWEEVFDEGISKGCTNLQMYGSCKPNHETYKLTDVYHAQIDMTDNEMMIKHCPSPELYETEQRIFELSARYPNHPVLFHTNTFMASYQPTNTPINKPIQFPIPETTPEEKQNDYQLVMQCFNMGLFKNMSKQSYTEWSKMGLFLKSYFGNTTEAYNAFTVYCQLAPDKFNEYDNRLKWDAFNTKDNEFTMGTFINWAKKDNPDIWDIVYKNNKGNDTPKGECYIDINEADKTDSKLIKMVRESISKRTDEGRKTDIIGAGDWDLALILYEMKKDEFRCVNIKTNMWYRYDGVIWRLSDCAVELRNTISNEMRDLYINECSITSYRITKAQCNCDPNDEEQQRKLKNLKTKLSDGLNIVNRLSKTSDKQNIMTEAKHVFYDGVFLDLKDNNPYLFAFNNVVWDLKKGCIVPALPEQYLTKSAGYDYDTNYDPAKKDELMDILDTIFIVKQTKEYYLSLLSTGLCGIQIENTFIATGEGGNGKSLINALMMSMVGEYGYKLPSSIILAPLKTGANPELFNLDKARFVLIQEPNCNKRINCSTLKELTGDSNINTRDLYSSKCNISICMTVLMEANDLPLLGEVNDAIVRRIRAIPFNAKYVSQDEYDNLLDKTGVGVANTYYKSNEFKTTYRQALFEILLHYFTLFINSDNNILKQSHECLEKSNSYLALSDDIYSWFNDRYTQTPTIDDSKPIKLKDIYLSFQESSVFENLSKMDKRKYNQSGFVEKIKKNKFLKSFIKPRNSCFKKTQYSFDFIIGWEKTKEDETIKNTSNTQCNINREQIYNKKTDDYYDN